LPQSFATIIAFGRQRSKKYEQTKITDGENKGHLPEGQHLLVRADGGGRDLGEAVMKAL
jgi:hypothetical protein